MTSLPLLLVSAQLLSLPGGLWETRSQMEQAAASPPAISLRICRAPAQLAADEPPPILRGCTVAATENLPGGVRRHYQCLGPHGTASATMTYEGEPVREWRLEQTIRPASASQGPVRLTMTARHLGACPAGMAPGTMELPGGRRVPVPDGN